MNNNDNRDKIKSAIIGALAGLITGVLIAPKSGKETREQIKNKYHDIKGDLSDKLQKSHEITEETYSDIVDQVVSSYEKNKKINRTEAIELKKKLREGYERIKGKIEE